MRISKNDAFDLNLCIRGMGVLVTVMHSDIYEFIYHFTFKKSMKMYAKDFKDPWEQPIEHNSFFHKIDDPLVQNCLETMKKLLMYKLEMILRFGIDEEEDMEDEIIFSQAGRYKPFCLLFKHSKSYNKLIPYYDRTLTSIIDSLFLYACALTAQCYKIPRILKSQLNLSDSDNFRLLNRDDHNVELLLDLIVALKQDLEVFKGVSFKRVKV
ncbi:hypothetical protein [Pedobacter gandavensis]|uniref:hypothetical protein n=1 Tax=Pedobacter gandavensis TaxID=2679963 RepID=UPI00293031F8|nr:hypothetical protein [Pedobacter gandavensis]